MNKSEITLKKLLYKNFYLLITLPSLLIVFGVTVFPVLFALYSSFFKINLVNIANTTFVSFQNYLKLLKDEYFWNSTKLTLILIIFSVGFQFLIGFLLAYLVNNERIKGNKVFRVSLLLPLFISPIVVGFMWKYLLHADYGLVNYILYLLGFTRVSFLGSNFFAFAWVILVDIWQRMPFIFIIVLAGLQSISKELIESASLDGANQWQILNYITIPILKPIIAVALIVATYTSFKLFDKIFVMTAGGPGNSTELLSLYVQRMVFSNLRLGYGSALAIGMFIMAFLIVAIYLRIIATD